ncbi:MAG: hypothetical protein OXI24_03320 [Candidatus Poribacteria bacterium]|nr:hypothetical protein [Candidatus Poribacteria bacterium]
MQAPENRKTSIQAALRDDYAAKDAGELRTHLKQLFATLEGDALVESVIENVQRYAVETLGESIDADFDDITISDLDSIRRTIHTELTEVISKFISGTHREAIVRYHARGFSTAEAITALMHEDTIMNRLAQTDALGMQQLRDLLIPRFAYLKPGTTRWPQQKYGAVWQEAREEYTHEINNIPLSSPVERASLLAKHAQRVNAALDNNEYSASAFQALTQSLTKTLESLEKLSPSEQPVQATIDTPQLAGILEKLTVALEGLQQPTYMADANALVEVLGKLAIAHQPPSEQKAITGETEYNTETEDN